jgi:hypothetical protein
MIFKRPLISHRRVIVSWIYHILGRCVAPTKLTRTSEFYRTSDLYGDYFAGIAFYALYLEACVVFP